MGDHNPREHRPLARLPVGQIGHLVTDVAQRDQEGADGQPASKDAPRSIFGGLMLFIRQVVAELSKVVTPTRRQLIGYFILVTIFVAFIMALVFAEDLLFTRLMTLLLADSGE